CGWTGGPITYFFGSGTIPDSPTVSGYAWSEFEKNRFRAALQLYENVANIHFQEVATYAQSNMVDGLLASTGMNIVWGDPFSLGAHDVPDQTYFTAYGSYNISAPVWSPTYLVQGGYSFVTFIHELGHALGLAHPHDGGTEPDASLFPGVSGPHDTGDFGLNHGIWPTMGVNDGWDQVPAVSYAYGWQGTPMAFDIAALQAIYGANTTFHNSDNGYSLPKINGSGTFWSCIWDTGGVDEITAAGAVG